MSQNITSCAICGHFVLYNATPTSTYEYEEPALIYDTIIKTSSGTYGLAKLIIPVTEATQYPDASIICVIARGGPMYPFGYLLQTTCILTLIPNTALYRDVSNHYRVSTLCKILSVTSNLENNRAYLERKRTHF